MIQKYSLTLTKLIPKESNMNKKVTFTDAKVGDRVWSITNGWGVVKERRSPHYQYPLNIEFEGGSCRLYTLWGRLHIEDQNPTLFWDLSLIHISEPTRLLS